MSYDSARAAKRAMLRIEARFGVGTLDPDLDDDLTLVYEALDLLCDIEAEATSDEPDVWRRMREN